MNVLKGESRPHQAPPRPPSTSPRHLEGPGSGGLGPHISVLELTGLGRKHGCWGGVACCPLHPLSLQAPGWSPHGLEWNPVLLGLEASPWPITAGPMNVRVQTVVPEGRAVGWRQGLPMSPQFRLRMAELKRACVLAGPGVMTRRPGASLPDGPAFCLLSPVIPGAPPPWRAQGRVTWWCP